MRAVVPFYVSTDGINHQKEVVDLDIRDFYQFMIDNPKVFPKTSMPSIQDYLDVFGPLAKDGIDIICICITTKFSGSYNSAMNAKNMLTDEFPDVKIEVIDATVNTVLQGMLVEEAVARASRRVQPLRRRLHILTKLKSLEGSSLLLVVWII